MTKVSAAEEAKYFEGASDWDIDQVQRSKQSEKRAWRVCGASIAIAALCASANFMLFPLKQVDYRIIRVDDVTGMVDVQRTTLQDAKVTYKEATDKYWIRTYVRTRESWLYDEYASTYRTIGLLSSAQEQKAWYAFFRPENAAAPINQYSNRTRVKVKIRSVTFIGKNLANVHFTKILEQNGAQPVESYWIATVPYRYVNEPASEDDREINPIGFQVTEGYRVDPETGVTTERTEGQP
jgi:type IV secretion system protein VirB8